MPSPISIIGLFCEDIRVENGGSLTLIGLLPDNINALMPPSPGSDGRVVVQSKALLRLCIYARANFEPNYPIDGPIKLHLRLPKGFTVPVGSAEPQVIEEAKKQAKENESPLAGVIMHAVLDGFVLPAPGIVRLEATIGEDNYLLAALNFKRVSEPTSASAPLPPSAQSPSASS